MPGIGQRDLGMPQACTGGLVGQWQCWLGDCLCHRPGELLLQRDCTIVHSRGSQGLAGLPAGEETV